MKRILFAVLVFLALGISKRDAFAFASLDSVKASQDSLYGFHMTKSPLVAVLLSAALPGAGQVYLGQAWKLPIIYGVFGSFLYGVLIQNFRYHYISDSVNIQLARGDVALAQRYVSVREFYRDDRDKWWIYTALAYVANILDAYIAAHLYDFDVSEPDAGDKMPAKIEQYFDPHDEHWRTQLQIRF